MKRDDQKTMREKLETRLEVFRRAARQNTMQPAWLRELRQALGIPAAEIAHRVKMNRTWVYRAEQDERNGCITLHDLDEMAHAMGCRVVYGLVPYMGGTLEDLARSLKDSPQRETPRIVAKREKKVKKMWDDTTEWRRKGLWERAADRQAAAVRHRILERAKSYGWSVEAAEKAMIAKEEEDGGQATGNREQAEGSEGMRDQGTTEYGLAVEPEYPAIPCTADELRRMGVGGAEALRAALRQRLRR